MPHVVFLPSWYPSDQAPTRGVYFRDQARLLHERGHTVGVVFPEHESLRHLTPGHLRTHHFQVGAEREDGIWTLRRHSWNVASRLPGAIEWRVRSAVRLMNRYVTLRGCPDIIHAHSAWWAGAAAIRIGETLGRPVVLTEHHDRFLKPESLSSRRQSYARHAFRSATAVSCVSRALRSSLRDWGVTREISVIPNPIFPSNFPLRSEPLRSPHDASFRFLAVGHLYAHKGMHTLIDAFAEAFPDADVELIIGGTGPERKRLQRQISDRALSSRVRLAGQLTSEQVVQHMHRADVFVLPSHREPFGVVVLEALACGMPVLATKSGGPSSIVTDDLGVRVAPGSVADLAHGLQAIRSRIDRFEPAQLRDAALRRFGPDFFAQRTEALYDSCAPCVS
jgi:glycosyltransferase involved in cell wall biosynthesis